MTPQTFSVPTSGPGRVLVGHSSELAGYFYVQHLYDDNRADAVSDKGEFPDLLGFMVATRGFIDWAQVPSHVIRSLLNEGDPIDREALRLIAAAAP